jgi:hypothetical protein
MLTDDIVRADRELDSLYVGLGAFQAKAFSHVWVLQGTESNGSRR